MLKFKRRTFSFAKIVLKSESSRKSPNAILKSLIQAFRITFQILIWINTSCANGKKPKANTGTIISNIDLVKSNGEIRIIIIPACESPYLWRMQMGLLVIINTMSSYFSIGSLASICFSHTSLVLLFILSRGGGGLKNIFNPLLSKRYLLLFYNLFRSYTLPPTTLLKGISFQIVFLYSSPRPPPLHTPPTTPLHHFSLSRTQAS